MSIPKSIKGFLMLLSVIGGIVLYVFYIPVLSQNLTPSNADQRIQLNMSFMAVGFGTILILFGIFSLV
jgi:hypothetical protein